MPRQCTDGPLGNSPGEPDGPRWVIAGARSLGLRGRRGCPAPRGSAWSPSTRQGGYGRPRRRRRCADCARSTSSATSAAPQSTAPASTAPKATGQTATRSGRLTTRFLEFIRALLFARQGVDDPCRVTVVTSRAALDVEAAAGSGAVGRGPRPRPAAPRSTCASPT